MLKLLILHNTDKPNNVYRKQVYEKYTWLSEKEREEAKLFLKVDVRKVGEKVDKKYDRIYYDEASVTMEMLSVYLKKYTHTLCYPIVFNLTKEPKKLKTTFVSKVRRMK